MGMLILSVIAYMVIVSKMTINREHKEYKQRHKYDRKHFTDNLHHPHKRKAIT